MQPKLRKAYDRSRSLRGKPFPSACYAPHGSLYFHTNGDVVACCKNTSYVLGNITRDRLTDIWDGKRTRALRKALGAYEFGLGCQHCEWQIEGRQFEQVHAKIYDELPVATEHPQWPTKMEFTLSNTCNLGCVMCFGGLSSFIRAHRDNLPPLPQVYDDRFFDDLRAFLPHLEQATFMGGEPFLGRENFRIWEMMIEDGVRFDCNVVTNGTQWNARVERVLEAIPMGITISMDGVSKEVVESIRVNAKFDQLVENVARFRDYTRRVGTRMVLAFCLMRQNWHEFGEYLRLADEYDVDVQFNTVVDPPECSLYTLTPEELLDVVKQLKRLTRREKYHKLRRNGWMFRSVVDALRDNANERQRAGVAAVKQAVDAVKVAARKEPLALAREALAREDREEALRQLARVEPHDKNFHQARVLEAQVLRGLKRYDESEAALGHAFDTWRKSPRALVERAWLRVAQRRFDDALVDCDVAREIVRDAGNPFECRVLQARAATLRAMGRLQDALTTVREIDDGQPNAADARRLEAELSRDLGG